MPGWGTKIPQASRRGQTNKPQKLELLNMVCSFKTFCRFYWHVSNVAILQLVCWHPLETSSRSDFNEF